MKYLIYRYKPSAIKESLVDENLRFINWKPSLTNFIPRGLPKKYFIYWLFHYLNFFSNSKYQAVLGMVGETLVCSFLIVPKYFRWPFMERNDVQFVYVKTYQKYKGKGYGYQALLHGIQLIGTFQSIWYVTDSENAPSMKLAEKTGFHFFSEGERSFLFGMPFLKTLKLAE